MQAADTTTCAPRCARARCCRTTGGHSSARQPRVVTKPVKGRLQRHRNGCWVRVKKNAYVRPAVFNDTGMAAGFASKNAYVRPAVSNDTGMAAGFASKKTKRIRSAGVANHGTNAKPPEERRAKLPLFNARATLFFLPMRC